MCVCVRVRRTAEFSPPSLKGHCSPGIRAGGEEAQLSEGAAAERSKVRVAARLYFSALSLRSTRSQSNSSFFFHETETFFPTRLFPRCDASSTENTVCSLCAAAPLNEASGFSWLMHRTRLD